AFGLRKSTHTHLHQQIRWVELKDVLIDLRTGLNPRKNFSLNTPGATGYYVTVRELGGRAVSFDEKTDRVDEEALDLIDNRSHLRAGDVLVSGTGTIGRTAFVCEKPDVWNIKEGVYAITVDSSRIMPMYLLHFFYSEKALLQLRRFAEGGTVASVSMAKMKRLRVPLPPLEEQQRIVAILDRFDTLVNDISQGLPAEIAARRKQYEYYRDRLLDFPRKEISA
ncbi:MAG: restriction endonuclease subunit S, partial [Slackia sp.]|nr:restriction endonuclease subunit S [Slackia sp.]